MKKLCLNIVTTLLVLIIVLFLAIFNGGYKKEQKKFDLPKIEITLNDVTLDKIISNSKDIKYYDSFVSIVDGDKNDEYKNVELKGRGNSTWGQPKSPFQIKFKEKVDLFGMGRAKKWVLLASYFDKSNLRNDAAFYLERMLEEEYALEGRFVELYINGENMGLYYLAEKVEIGKERVNLKDPYGIIVEVENMRSEQEQCYWTSSRTCLVIHDTVVDNNADEAMKEFWNDFGQLELVAKAGNYEEVKKLVDAESFAIYYLLSEFTVNPDVYETSYYFYKDGKNDLIHVGPGWDFDYAMGNREWIWGYDEEFYLPETSGALKINNLGGEVYNEYTGKIIKNAKGDITSNLIYDLLEMPEFQEVIAKVYKERLMGRKNELLKYVGSHAIKNMKVAIRDRKLWRSYENEIVNTVGTEDANNTKEVFHGGLPAKEAYMVEVVNLIDWLGRRFDHMDMVYNYKPVIKINDLVFELS